jgi:adenine-specific DNA-methyltransferase
MNATTKLVTPWYIAKRGQEDIAEFYKISAELLLATLSNNSIDLIVTSPPYCMGMEYEKSTSAADFLRDHKKLFPEIARVLKPGGSACWQVGHHVRDGIVVPLDALVYIAAQEAPELVLRNRIIWTFGHGLHAPTRFSGRHETVLWFTKGNGYTFNLDSVRVPQKYPGKRHYKGDKKGEFSGNPLGKNPSDVWDIPNVKAKHVEKTAHPCQFPVAIPRRLILALTKKNALVLDPYMGSGSTGVAAMLEGRRFVGGDTKPKYLKIAKRRVLAALGGDAAVRPDGPPRIPKSTEAVSKLPSHFRNARRKRHGKAL